MKLGFKRRALSWIFPERCAFCGCVIEAGSETCAHCAQTYELQELPLCHTCGESKKTCVCKRKAHVTDGIVSSFVYVGPAKRAVLRLKRGVSPEETATLARFMCETVRREYADVAFDAVVFVPKTKRELRKRGANSAAALAEEIAKQSGIPVWDALVKLYETRPQKELSALERSGNLHGVLDVAKGVSVERKTLLLVDDVRTTGATLRECALMLKIYGAKEVYAVTLAATRRKDGKEADADGGNSNGH